MAIALRSSNTYTSIATLSAPAGTQATDILTVSIALPGGALVTPPTGWTLIDGYNSTTWGNLSYWALGNVASFAFTFASGNSDRGIICAWSGVDTTAPIRAVSKLTGNDGGSGSMVIPTITVSAGDTLVAVASQQNANIPGATSGSPATTNIMSAAGTNTGFSVDYVNGLSAGTTTAYSRTTAGFNTNFFVTFALAAIVYTATATTLAGPTSGNAGYPSTNFTVGANGTTASAVVITPSDSGAGGTFTPTTVSISNAVPTGTFKYTPNSAGTKVISTTNSGGLSNPSTINYVSTLLVGVVMFDFGSVPGTNVANSNVLDAAVTGTSKIDIYLMGTDNTPDHNSIEHQYLPLGFVSLQATGRSAGVGFTAQAATPLRLTGVFKARYVIQ